MLERYKNIIFAAVIVAIVGGVVTLLTYRPAPVVITINPPPATATPQPLRVYVTGAVNAPLKTYELPPGSRIQDALTAAGGARQDADLTRINLAQPLRDGEQINVPVLAASAGTAAPGSAALAAPPPQSTPTGKAGAIASAIRINSASKDELQALPGVGPALADRIIEYRTKNGPFKNAEDLDKVSGIGATRIEQWKGLISFD